jgi:hypothetical protein
MFNTSSKISQEIFRTNFRTNSNRVCIKNALYFDDVFGLLLLLEFTNNSINILHKYILDNPQSFSFGLSIFDDNPKEKNNIYPANNGLIVRETNSNIELWELSNDKIFNIT